LCWGKEESRRERWPAKLAQAHAVAELQHARAAEVEGTHGQATHAARDGLREREERNECDKL